MLSGRLALVTGGASGIGKAVANCLAKEGASVVVADLKEDSAVDVAKNLRDLNDIKHYGLAVDVSSIKSVLALFAQIRNLSDGMAPSIVVNSAGITKDNFILKMDERAFNHVIDVNLKGTFLIMQNAAAAMLDAEVKRGSIVNMASIVGKVGNIGQCNYAASKAGVEALTKTAAKEFARYNIRCNAILPGFVETPMTDKIPDKVKTKLQGLIPQARFGDPRGNVYNLGCIGFQC
ncbi:hypothetical protein QYM36_018095 [Artemia franciscana]|uniref:(3R)-3-hydroxyacyl-CoA dehydrogenase n=1 Tax=Artemia franciscana TaxID=6661 RepID=A0AA88HDB3_ARTSF|nr:hypothetical protein QYM36_018095 [Artemia franciscana]